MQEKIKLTQFSKGGGCGCKIAPSVLQQILSSSKAQTFSSLLVGNETSDDAAVFQLNQETSIISTTDFFVPIVDDPFDFGRIAAANAISDVYAMGGQPLIAIAILGWPVNTLSIEAAQKVLEGGRSICSEANIPLAGGHTIDTSEPIFGLAVTGSVHPKKIKKNNTAQEGDQLFLTKPIGVGVLSTALKRDLLQDEHYKILVQQMTALNKVGEALGAIADVHAMTDITGFGLLGHLIEMAEGSGLSAELNYSAIKKIEGLDVYLRQRTIPDATFRNWNSYSAKTDFKPGVDVMEAFNVLPDPQTNGGLLIATTSADSLKEIFQQYGLSEFLVPIGRCIAQAEKTITIYS